MISIRLNNLDDFISLVKIFTWTVSSAFRIKYSIYQALPYLMKSFFLSLIDWFNLIFKLKIKKKKLNENDHSLCWDKWIALFIYDAIFTFPKAHKCTLGPYTFFYLFFSSIALMVFMFIFPLLNIIFLTF